MVAKEDGVSLAELAELTGSELVGDGDRRVRRVAVLARAQAGDVAFLANPRYRRFLAESGASAVVLSREDLPEDVADRVYLVNDNPYLAFARVARRLNPLRRPRGQVASTASVSRSAHLGRDVHVAPGAVVEAGAVIGDGVIIGANSVIGRHSVIGEDSRVMANVTVYEGCVIGARAVLHGGCVIGADGFGFAPDDGVWEKVPQLGGVIIGDDVEVGANSCVDRGAIEDTVIENGVKLDNFVQIAHNVRIGAHTVMAAKSGVSGSTTIGGGCAIGGGVGIGGHLTIAAGSVLTAMARITHSIREAGVYSSGTPMAPAREWRRNAARFNQLDEFVRRLRDCERRLDAYEKEDDQDTQ